MAELGASHNHRDCKECRAPTPAELKPFFDVLFLDYPSVCDGRCGGEIRFTSAHPDGCYGRIRDEALAAKNAGWIVRSVGGMVCPACAKKLKIQPDGTARRGLLDSNTTRIVISGALALLLYRLAARVFSGR